MTSKIIRARTPLSKLLNFYIVNFITNRGVNV